MRNFLENKAVLTSDDASHATQQINHSSLTISIVLTIVLIFLLYSGTYIHHSDYPASLPVSKDEQLSKTDNPSASLTKKAYFSSIIDRCPELSQDEAEKYDSILRDGNSVRYDFNLSGVGPINLAEDRQQWSMKLSDAGGDPSLFRYSVEPPHILFTDLNGDCQYDAISVVDYFDPDYSQSETNPTWVNTPLLYVFLNHEGIFTPLTNHIRFEKDMKVVSVTASNSTITIGLEFPIEKNGNIRSRKVIYDVSTRNIISIYDSFDDITKWPSAWESGVDATSGITFSSPLDWGAAYDNSNKPFSDIAHTITFARSPANISVYSTDYLDANIKKISLLACSQNDLDTTSPLIYCKVSHMDDKDFIIRAGVEHTNTALPIQVVAIADIVLNDSQGQPQLYVRAKTTLPNNDVFSEYITGSIFDNTISNEGAGLSNLEWTSYYNMAKSNKNKLGQAFNRFSTFVPTVKVY